MSDVAIQVKGLSKRYRIGESQRYKALRDTLTDAMYAPLRAAGSLLNGRRSAAAAEASDRFIWALKDVSFEVERGEVVGVIGRNGAGKSTLLKILSRITEPTEGYAEIHGRVGSLLEVGTGFHPELTGRENIYLNGAILGMKKAEINRKFDEIVAFAEIEKFIDTAAKYYSSGMYLRLAFAVAAHLEPEVLLVDEVLAVGDIEFQKRCLGKMDEVGRSGRTVLFVSHNMQHITRLCERILLLDRGRLVQDGATSDVVAHYLRSDLGTTAAREWPDLKEAPGDGVVRLRAVRVCGEDRTVLETVDIRRPIRIVIEYEVLQSGAKLTPVLNLTNQNGIIAFASFEPDAFWNLHPRDAGSYVSAAEIPGNLLAEGTYVVRIVIASLNPLQKHVAESDTVAFYVVDPAQGDSARGNFGGNVDGVVRPLLAWRTQQVDTPNAVLRDGK